LSVDKDQQLNLKDLISQLRLARDWLSRSLGQCQAIGLKQNYTADEFGHFESLSSRFGRAGDLLVQRVYRSIDRVEFAEPGTLLDALNRAEKRGLIDSKEQIREIKDLRNVIVHEYMPSGVIPIFEALFEKSAVLLDLIDRTIKYSEKLKL